MLRLVAACLLASCLSSPACADSFTRFSFKEYEGWVEDTGSSIRVQVIPFLLGPDMAPPALGGFFNFSTPVGHDAPRIKMLADGRVLLPYKIINNGGLPQDAWPSIAASTGISQVRLQGAPVSFVKSRLNRVSLKISGEVFASEDLGGSVIGGEPIVNFYLPPDRPELLDALRAGAYSVVLDYEYSLADVSSLTLDMTVQQLSQMWVSAFREVTRSKSSSGGKFLFMDFSHKVSRTRVKESIASGASEQGLTDITIVLRDPTAAMADRVNEVLGFAKLTRADALARHQAGYTAAIAAGSPNLADAHLRYLDALGDAPPNDNGAALLAALSKLKDSEGLQFLAAGFQMSESSSSSYYRYDYAMSANASSEAHTTYREYVISNSMVQARYEAHRNPGAMPAALAAAASELHNGIFPMITPGQPLNQFQWIAGASQAIDNRNLGALQYVFSAPLRDTVADLDIDAAVDAQGNRLIHLAARKKSSQPMLAIMLRNGASPLTRNSIGDLPEDSAADAGENDSADFLYDEAQRSGTFTAMLSAPGALQLALSPQMPREAALPSATTISPTTVQLDYRGYPRITRLSGVARIVFQLPISCTSIGFSALIQQHPNFCRIVQDVPFTGGLRIKENQKTKANGEFKFGGPLVGYQFQQLIIAP